MLGEHTGEVRKELLGSYSVPVQADGD
jgi:hypothetical protein